MKCLECGKEIPTTQKYGFYCSDKCGKDKHWTETLQKFTKNQK